MVIEENTMFYTPKTSDELMERIEQIASGSSNPAAVWTAVMMMQNFIAVETKAVDFMN
jgi:predicted transcriptional regulator